MLRKLVVGSFALGLAALSAAGPLSYAGKSIPIHAGTLVIDSQAHPNGEAMNPTPHVWGMMDSDFALKPAGWTLTNPRAQTVVTQTSFDRWTRIHAALGIGGFLPNVGSRLSKRDAPYWEVDLDEASDERLSDYDVLLLPLEGTLSLNTIEREKLRRFVDGGGLLWISVESASAIVDPYNPAPLPFQVDIGSGPIYADPSSSLLSTPNRLSISDLGAVFRSAGSQSIVPPSGFGIPLVQGWVGTDFYKLNPVVGENGNSMVVSLGRIGDGFVMVTTRSVAGFINQGLDVAGIPTINNGFRSAYTSRTRNYTTCAKLVYNALYLASQYSTDSRGSRRTNSIGAEITPPLSRKFSWNQVPNGTVPTLFKGKVILTAGNRIVALDAQPGDDMDRDGNPDDGLIDPLGSEVDVLWSTPLPGANLSTPTVTELPRAGASFRTDDVALIQGMEASGVVYMLNADTGALITTFAAPSPNSQAPSSGPMTAPVVHEGLALISETRTAGNLGRVWVVDLVARSVMISNGNQWAVQGAARLGPVGGAPTVGYIPILDNSGGMDRVVYVPTAPATGRTAGFVSLWLGARGEAPASLFNNGIGYLQVTTRAALQNLPLFMPGAPHHLGMKLSARRLDPVTKADLGPIDPSTVFTGSVTQGGQNGVILVQLTGTGNGLVWTGTGQNAALRMDYTIDWGAQPTPPNPTSPESFIRGEIQFPDDAGGAQTVLGNIALSKDGNLFVVVAPPGGTAGGSLYCIKEYGRGDFRTLYRWDAYDQIPTFSSQSVSGGVNLSYEPSIIDHDGLLDFPFIGGLLDRRMTNIRFAGGPSVQGDTVYVTLSSGKQIPFLPPGFTSRFTTTVLAMKANPAPMEIEVDGLTNSSFAILQPDIVRSLNKTNPNVLTVLQPQQFTFTRQGSRGVITLTNSASVSRGRIRDCIASNLPIIIRQTGQPDIVIEPELDQATLDANPGSPFVAGNGSGRWNPQRWQMVINGMDATSAPFSAGDILYVGGGSYLPRLFNTIAGGGPPNFTTTDGLLYALNTRIAPNDLKIPNTRRTWMNPLVTPRTWQPTLSGIDMGVSGEWLPSQYVLMPQAYGVLSFDDFRIRLNQAVLADPAILGMSGGEGSLALWGANNSYLFARGNFLVADETRIIRVDSVGNPIWSSDSTAAAGTNEPVGTAARSLGLGRPSRVYPTSNNGMLVADPNNNRIMEVDAAGREVRTISKIKLHPSYRPDGTPDNPVLALSGPRDVLTWTSFVPAANNPYADRMPDEYWVHYLIADTGNSRIVELVDRYEYDRANGIIGQLLEYVDPNSSAAGGRERCLGLVYWQTRSELSKRRYAYNSIDRTFFRDTLGNTIPIYAFGFGNSEPTDQSFGLDRPPATGGNPDNMAGAGGIVLYNPNGGAYKVIAEFGIPAIARNVFWDDAAVAFQSPAVPARDDVHILGLKSATIRFVNVGGTPQLAVMFTDNTGVYELIETAPGTWTTRWMLPREAYRNIRFANNGRIRVPSAKNPEEFQPTFARRLDNGEVLVVNGFVGRHRLLGVPSFGVQPGDPFTGEVIQLEGSIDPSPGSRGFDWNKPNLGFDNFSVNFELPPIQGARKLVAPAFADKR